MTPKRIEAMIFVANKRRQRQRAEAVVDYGIAARGEQKAVDGHVKELLK